MAGNAPQFFSVRRYMHVHLLICCVFFVGKYSSADSAGRPRQVRVYMTAVIFSLCVGLPSKPEPSELWNNMC